MTTGIPPFINTAFTYERGTVALDASLTVQHYQYNGRPLSCPFLQLLRFWKLTQQLVYLLAGKIRQINNLVYRFEYLTRYLLWASFQKAIEMQMYVL
jgi:hypothetical protein